MNTKEANIILNYGYKAYKFFWIKQCRGGIYYGFYDKHTAGEHMSYHKDGCRHTATRNGKKGEFKSIPLSEISGLLHLFTVCPGAPETTDFLCIPYNNEPLSNIIWVDMRLFSESSTVNIHVLLIRPERISELSSRWFTENVQGKHNLIQILNAFDPWIIVRAVAN